MLKMVLAAWFPSVLHDASSIRVGKFVTSWPLSPSSGFSLPLLWPHDE